MEWIRRHRLQLILTLIWLATATSVGISIHMAEQAYRPQQEAAYGDSGNH